MKQNTYLPFISIPDAEMSQNIVIPYLEKYKHHDLLQSVFYLYIWVTSQHWMVTNQHEVLKIMFSYDIQFQHIDKWIE